MKNTESILLFKFHSKAVRTAQHNGQPYFCAADLCAVLNIKWSRKATLEGIPSQWQQGLATQAPNGEWH